MIAVIQRIEQGNVTVDGQICGACGNGLCVLLGVAAEDTENDAELLAKKILNLRIFTDDAGKMNLSLMDIGGEMLLVSNFTLLASYKKGNRPDYMGAAAPAEADRLYRYFGKLCENQLKRVGYGKFGEHMKVNLVCDGPVTITMDSRILKPSGRK